jgi:hypothetical protein
MSLSSSSIEEDYSLQGNNEPPQNARDSTFGRVDPAVIARKLRPYGKDSPTRVCMVHVRMVN